MRYPFFLLPCLVLSAQDADLPAQLAKVQRLTTDQLLSLQARLAADPAPAASKAYHELYLTYTLASRDPKGAKAMVERSLRALEGSKDPERMALEASFCGLLIKMPGAEVMTLAPRAMALFAQALAQQPANPRILVAKGVHVLYTPAFYGGGPAAAMPILEAAAKAAAAEPAPTDPWAPRWGRVESLGWLAYAQAEAGLRAEAKASVAQALALDPANGFIQRMVLPRLQEKPQ